jgi:hypothetical protein
VQNFLSLEILHEGYTADYFLNGMKPNALFPILFIQNNLFKKKSGIRRPARDWEILNFVKLNALEYIN